MTPLLADDWRDATTEMQGLIYARQLIAISMIVGVFVMQLVVITMQVYKVVLHRRTARRVTVTLDRMDEVTDGNMAVLRAYRTLAASHENMAAATLTKVVEKVEQGAAAATRHAEDIAAKIANPPTPPPPRRSE